MMKKIHIILAALFIAVFALTSLSAFKNIYAAGAQGIVAVVNEDIISVSDLNKRLRLIMVSSGLPDNAEIRAKLTPQIVGVLIDEQLMLQEGRRLDMPVMPEEIEQGFATIAQQNKMSPEQFKGVLNKGGIDISTMRRQIEAQISWSKVVQGKLSPRVVISDMDVEDALARMRAKIGTTEFLVAEIYLPVNNPKNEAEVKGLANRMLQEIRGGKASFFKLAQQFSKAAGSARGGDVGWLNETQLSSEVLSGLKGIQKNQVTTPIKSLTGYHLYFLRETRTLSEDTMPSRDQVYHDIGDERLDRLQRRHLMDIKTSSFVDIRV